MYRLMSPPSIALVPALLLGFPTAEPAAQVQWSQRTAGVPLPRYRHALAYDDLRQETVLFSGAVNPVADTWVWDGNAWAQRFPSASPSPQTGHLLAQDTVRGVTVLYGRNEFGSQTPETFEWDGTNWTKRFPAAIPSNRDRSAMAFDAARGECVLFGGHLFFTPKSDTWVWDGTNWVQLAPATVPPARSLHAMAYDAARGRVVMFGGFGTTELLGDTWEWDGTNWTQRFPATNPPPRESMAMAYDAARGRVVMYGGFVPNGAGAIGDTWEWDGTDWIERFPSTTPPTLFDYAMAYDSTRGVTVLHGGTSGATVLTGTWEWDGNDWTEREIGPPPRERHALAYDSSRARTVLFGGFHDPLYLDDTWEWDGTQWIETAPATRPIGRIETGLAHDSARGLTVMFGGKEASGEPLGDTWEWNGTDWIERFPAASPAARFGHALAYDVGRGRTVLFGGRSSDFASSLNDTWEWDGTTWVLRSPAMKPPARENHVLAYDVARARTVLFGGELCPPFQNCTPYGDTWEWNGTGWMQRASGGPAPRAYTGLAFDRHRSRSVLFSGAVLGSFPNDVWEWNGGEWIQRSPGAGPTSRSWHGLAFDSSRGRTVLFGGLDRGPHVTSETWEYFAPCDMVGPGHAGGGLAISCTAAPTVGGSFCVTFTDPASSGLNLLAFGPGPCLVPPAPLGGSAFCAPGFFYVRQPQTMSGSGSPALFCATLPNDPGLAGMNFCAQGAVRETGSCWRVTNGLALTVQP
jgi:hypothetical protein